VQGSTYGNAAHKIVEYAKEKGLDFIVLGAMEESGKKDLFLASWGIGEILCSHLRGKTYALKRNSISLLSEM